MRIKELKARRIVDSKNNYAVEVSVKGDEGIGIGSIGSGTSKGKYEVNDYPKRNIDFVINYFNNNIRKKFENVQINSFDDLDKIERVFKAEDSTLNLEKLGGNIILASEFAILRAASKGDIWRFLSNKGKMPMLLGNCIGGGRHAINGPDFQEFLLLPKTKNFNEGVFVNNEVYKLSEIELRKHDKNFLGTKTIENAWCPGLNNIQILDILSKISKRISREYKIDIRIGLDVAANSLWNGRRYQYKKFARLMQKRALNEEMQIKYIQKLIENYELVYVEDPLNEENFEGFKELNKGACLISGDDLIATNIDRLNKAAREKSISAVIIKPNQIGSLLKTKEVVDFAKKNKIVPVISHRSNETNDDMIAHLAVGWEIPIIKTGISGGERLAKINELIRINENL